MLLHTKIICACIVAVILLTACSNRISVPEDQIRQMSPNQLVRHAIRITSTITPSEDVSVPEYHIRDVAAEMLVVIGSAAKYHDVKTAERVIAASYADSWIIGLAPCCTSYYMKKITHDPVTIAARDRYFHTHDLDDLAAKFRSLHYSFRRLRNHGKFVTIPRQLKAVNHLLHKGYKAELEQDQAWSCVIRIMKDRHGDMGEKEIAGCIALGGDAELAARQYVQKQQRIEKQRQREKAWSDFLAGDKWHAIINQVKANTIAKVRRLTENCGYGSLPFIGSDYTKFASWRRYDKARYRKPTKDSAKLHVYATKQLKHDEAVYVLDGGNATFKATPFVTLYVARRYCDGAM